ncbi:MAG: GNAT family N-acetyltransferase [Clostridia bacterium]|nr:GNAT family N-acetyltransferase [Clostridia bacterium]
MNITFEPVKTPEQIALTAKIAEPIWHETYEPIIGRDAVVYMVDKFQSVPAINRQLSEEGYVYYLILADGEAAGFIGLVPHKEGKMFLSKLYVSHRHRGEGVPHAAFDFITALCREAGIDKIYLTVNKCNFHAIEVYRHYGFYEIDAVVSDIGCGYVMDDYILQKDV